MSAHEQPAFDSFELTLAFDAYTRRMRQVVHGAQLARLIAEIDAQGGIPPWRPQQEEDHHGEETDEK
jgi:hypothetical protein